MSHILGY